MSRTAVTTLLVALFAAASAGAADVIYKVRLKDGSVAYTDKPPAGAVVLEKREIELPPPAPPSEKLKAEGAAVDERLRKREAQFEQKNAAVTAAERALAQARSNLEKGREPREGDFIGTATKGFVRHSPAYEERLRSLEQAVADAEARLAKAEEARNAAR
jgi:Skp family chaperone for outer membrane proteins